MAKFSSDNQPAKDLLCPFQSSSFIPYYCDKDKCALWTEVRSGDGRCLVCGCAMKVTAKLLMEIGQKQR